MDAGAVAAVAEDVPGGGPVRTALAARSEGLPLDAGEENVTVSLLVRWCWGR